MALDVQLNNNIEYIQQTGAVGDVSSNNAVSQPAIDVTKGGVEDQINVKSDTILNEQKTLRSETEVLNSFRSLLTKNSKLPNISNEDLIRIIETASGKNILDLQNVEDSEINKYVDVVKYVLLETSDKLGAKATIDDILKIANGYNIAINTAWSAEGFYNQQKNVATQSLTQALAKFSSEIRDKGFNNVSEDEQKRAIKAFFHDFFENKVNGQSKEYVVKLQLQTFGRILVNSSEEERAAFKEVVKNMLSDNMSEADAQVLNSLNSIESKQSYIHSWTLNDYKALKLPDHYNNVISDDNITAVTTRHAMYRGKENALDLECDLHSEYSELFNEHEEEIKEILKLVEEGKELTPEQQKLKAQYDLYVAITTGNTSGTAASQVMSEADRDEVLNVIMSDMSENEDFYRTVLDKVNKYIEAHQDELSLDSDTLANILDKASNGNYSLVKNDYNASLNEQTKGVSSASSTSTEAKSSGSLGFDNKESAAVSFERKEWLQEDVRRFDDSNVTNPISNPTVKKRADYNTGEEFFSSATIEEINAYFVEDPVAAIQEALGGDHKNLYAYDKALDTFSRMTPAMQVIIIPGIGKASGVKDAYTMMKASVLDRLTGTSYATEKARKEILERKQKELDEAACAQ